MDNDFTYDLINESLEGASRLFAYAYHLIDMRRIMHYLQDDPSALNTILSPGELARFEKYALPKKKLQWLAGRSAVKTALIKHMAVRGQNLKMPSIDLFNNENSAPYILQFSDIRVSITHSFPYCIGVVSDRRIGIDLEKMLSPRKAMFDLFFHPNEIRSLTDQGEKETYQFLTMMYWTRKEALSKLLGLGMRAGFKELDTTNDDLKLNEFGEIRVRLRSYRCSDFVCSIAVEVPDQI